MTFPPTTGARDERTFTVTEADTATALGSGSLPVLATPRLLAWCESVTCLLLEDPTAEAASSTSVGTRVRLDHVAASPVTARVVVAAEVTHVDGRLVRFEVVARQLLGDGGEQVVAHGEVTRVVVDRDRFVARLRR